MIDPFSRLVEAKQTSQSIVVGKSLRQMWSRTDKSSQKLAKAHTHRLAFEKLFGKAQMKGKRQHRK